MQKFIAQDCCDVVKRCAAQIAPLGKSQREHFLMEQFRGSIEGNITESNGGLKFKMDFKINLGLSESYTVCRKVFCFCWGVSEYEVKLISKALKDSDGGHCNSYSTRALTENSNLGGFKYNYYVNILTFN